MSINKVFARACSDPDYKARLLRDPRTALAEEDVRVGSDATVVVMENTADTQHIVLPLLPTAGAFSLDELEHVAATARNTPWCDKWGFF